MNGASKTRCPYAMLGTLETPITFVFVETDEKMHYAVGLGNRKPLLKIYA